MKVTDYIVEFYREKGFMISLDTREHDRPSG